LATNLDEAVNFDSKPMGG